MRRIVFVRRDTRRLLTILLVFALSVPWLYAQVTIGADTPPHNFSVLEVSTSGTKGGLRLPQLTTAERNAWRDYFLGKTVNASGGGVTPDELANASGLAIFNTDIKCYEYWNSGRWVSLCEGNSQMTINPQPCQNVAADGTGCDKEFTVTDPDCLNGPFTIVVVAGSGYASLHDLNEVDGIFKIVFQPNNSVNPRSAVVRVTSSCTGLYKDFLFIQSGFACDASLGNAPAITAVPSSLKFCAGGAAYLSIDKTAITGTGTLGDVIWTRNNIEIAHGVNNIVVTQNGKYEVWMGFIGCNAGTGSSVDITRDGTGAPKPVDIVVAGNNGMVCGPAGTTTLVALNPNSGGTVLWFKDGILQDGTGGTQNITGTQVTVGIGEWFAVVKDGDCYSFPSETVSVQEDSSSGSSLTVPVIDKGGSFCAGSSILLSVSSGSYDASYSYIWYENNTQIGTGRSVMYTVPSGVASVVIRCQATLAGSCAQEALTVEAISVGTIPAMPAISGNTVLCSGRATLNVIPSGTGAYTYAWYKDNTLIGTSQQQDITSGGDYYATVTEVGGCTSPMAHINIPDVSSANPTITLTSSSATPNTASVNDEVTYHASITFGPALSYIWTITGATLRQGGQPGDTYAVVKFGTAGTASVKVEASNACGMATVTQNVTVNTQCADPNPATVSPSGDKSITVAAGSNITLGPVSVGFASGSPATAYQWYRNTSKSTSGATSLGTSGQSNTLAVNNVAAGTWYYYCVMTNKDCTSASVQTGYYTVTALSIPSTAGTGSFTGRTCFDIATGNNGGACSTLTARNSQKTDFARTEQEDMQVAGSSVAPYSGKQVYTFTPSGNVSNVQFTYKDPSGEAIESITPVANYSGNISSGSTCKVVVVYKSSLNIYLKNRNNANALKPELYVLYKNGTGGGTPDRYVRLNVSLQDCVCCGAVTTSKGWLRFMCHNLGADESSNPFTYVPGNTDGSGGTLGWLFQWGRKADGHQKRNSGTTSSLAGSNTLTHSNFIYTVNTPYDWRSGGGNNNRWGDGSTNERMAKGVNDPCPSGWKVPSQKEWGSIFRGATTSGAPSSATANKWTWQNFGYRVGDYLYLQSAGNRRSFDAVVSDLTSKANYWSSTVSGERAYSLYFTSSTIYPGNVDMRSAGFSVRCVSE